MATSLLFVSRADIFFYRPSDSALETSLRRSATYEHELKHLEVHPHRISSGLLLKTICRRGSSRVSVIVERWRASFMILSTRSRCAASHFPQGLASVADWSSQHKFKEEIPSGGPRHGACPTDRPGARRLATRARRAGGPPARHPHAGCSSSVRVRFWSPKGSVACKQTQCSQISPSYTN
jgi:hypothetical protein